MERDDRDLAMAERPLAGPDDPQPGLAVRVRARDVCVSAHPVVGMSDPLFRGEQGEDGTWGRGFCQHLIVPLRSGWSPT